MNLPLQSLPVPRASDPEALAREIVERLAYRVGKDPAVAKPHDWLQAVILITRDRAIEHWMQATRETYREGAKRVYYLSLEFLIGRLMRDAVSNLGLTEAMRAALRLLDVDYDEIAELEADAALGNGGLGRLAACFMESMATVGIPAYGYGIRYRHGLFRQEILDGWQAEMPETWLEHGNPWEFDRREAAYDVCFGGRVEYHDPNGGGERFTWVPAEKVKATAYDTPVVGWRAARVNTLRLWKADPIDPIRLDAFNAGDHSGSLAEANRADALTRVLYPADTSPAGQELRLRQEYFFSSASLQDILRRHLQQYGRLDNLAEKVAIQLNDTHPAVCVAELMRLLTDVHELEFDAAWALTTGCIAYTNHTLLPEALESWPVPLFERLLPRHMQIIYEINARLLKSARAEHGMSGAEIRRISLIEENGERRVRMGNLAFVGAHSINGVAAMHSELLKETLFHDLNRMFPGRINNKTNGITPRRWLQQCNPGLTRLIADTIGPKFLDDIDALRELEKFADEPAFQDEFARVKRRNKDRLAKLVRERLELRVDPNAIFDVQIKRIHEYKRQLLNIIEAVALYDQIRSHPERNWTPRVKFFAGKAAPTYHNAKLIIKLANDVARVINGNPTVREVLRVVFIPNYNVSLAEVMVPAADLSEQISTAGMEASGTGNMKFALNGAITIGTLDGANIEIREAVGAENVIIFGLTAEEVAERHAGGHDPRKVIERSPELGQALSSIASGVFSPDDPGRYRGLIGGLYEHDYFMVASDFDAYCAAQRQVDALWADPSAWWRKAILNTARMGWFSSDRTIRQYAQDIWGIPL
ncbi:glycogen/starch/alpha-glucan phosphorylase [Amaricoccus sp.]|uniref:glycogen/starch/alpha-glucan phosphorylase n=1 Tax=Amaricoccus sp. TaxID=1872485 RepID=UPI00261EF7E0|nr:glycogen/starch/alpha-glucan phosphorylase [Amaricoccus sp.]HRO11460.1 glycogen/starch/alpha-glucan phosphorylase [Amaricoccus sp.]